MIVLRMERLDMHDRHPVLAHVEDMLACPGAILVGDRPAVVAGTTRIVVAQRVSTIVDADRIVVLEDGRVVGLGTHEELLATNDTYREIADSQMAVEA